MTPLRRSVLPAAVAAVVFLAAPAYAQVGVGTATPDAKAALDIQAADKGLLIPRLDSAQRATIVSPPDGLMVFQKNGRVGLWYAFGGQWFYIPDKVKASDNLGNHTATAALNLQGNALRGTGASISGVGVGVRADGGLNLGQNTPGNNIFVGFETGKSNDILGYGNHFFGYRSGYSNTTGFRNQFFGYQSGYSNTTGGGNQFFGYQSGYSNTTGDSNYFSGHRSGYSNTTGSINYFSGNESGSSNTTGSVNHFSGYLSGHNNTTGSRNHFNGYGTGLANTTGNNNHFSGNNSGYRNTTGSNNYFSGYESGLNNATGNSNEFVGYRSGFRNTTGKLNLFVGDSAGVNNSTGNRNYAFGMFAGPTTGNLTNAGAIGYNARVSQSNSMVLGGTGADAVNVGIGTTAPNTRVSISPTTTEAKITLWDGGNAASHYGFGISGGQLNYHVNDPGASHVFYAQGKNGDGTELLRVRGDGNVGIGTNTPTQRLEVAGQIYSSTGGIRFPDNTVQTTAAAADNLGNHSATQNLTLNTANDLLLRDAADTNHGLGWYGGGKLWGGAALDGPALYGFGGGALGTNTGGTRTTALYWNNTGSVGVGTTTPNTRVSISPTTTEAKITLWDGGNAASHYGFGISGGQLNYHVNDPGASHVFYAQGKNGDGTELLRVRGDGNVGIGTTAPTQRLEVAGQIYSSTGGIRFPDNTVQTTAAASDNLGNHTATTALNLQGNALTGNGASIGGVGIGVRDDGGLNMGQNTLGNNIFVGFEAGAANTTSVYNCFFGYQSGRSNTGFRNHFVGYQSGYSNTNASFNHFEGFRSGRDNTTGSNNYFSGHQSGFGNTTGSNNSFIGNDCGRINTTGSNNTAIGNNAGPLNGFSNLTNTTAIGYNARVSQSNSLVLGGTGFEAVNVGIGTTAPNSTLNVAGSVSVAHTTISTDLTLTRAHYTVRRASGCNTITLPQPSTCTGRVYVIVNPLALGTFLGLSVATSGAIFDETTNTVVTTLSSGSRITLQSDGTNWVVIGR